MDHKITFTADERNNEGTVIEYGVHINGDFMGILSRYGGPAGHPAAAEGNLWDQWDYIGSHDPDDPSSWAGLGIYIPKGSHANKAKALVVRGILSLGPDLDPLAEAVAAYQAD